MNRRLLAAQGGYYLVTGVWPLLHFRSFTTVAGPKPDRFQTQVAGALFAAAGLALLAGRPLETGTRVLSGATAAAAMLMDLAYLPRIRKIFLAEACVEAAFLAAALRGRRGSVKVGGVEGGLE
ncbi:hypothetical protein HC031_02395 [Planosporangium thailandense]|uniref:DUF4345 domain-containing protein n=1 Tax=Planosporangium thailandense TaxID=765197 RepID=A0ABX0XRJ2_9ACTN|nr:hypothetical protein [Planosporangium thailandense]NJC68578.1 hypothetical protein [Planosporangium thailandense]